MINELTVMSAPVLEVRLDGSDADPDVMSAVVDVDVVQRLNRPAHMSLTMRFGGFDAAARARRAASSLQSASRVRVSVRGHDIDVFDGSVTHIEQQWNGDGSLAVVCGADDALHELRRSRLANTYEASSAADVAGHIADRHGLGVQMRDATVRRAYIQQPAENDLATLCRLLGPLGLSFALRGDTIHIFNSSGDDAGIGDPIELIVGNELLDVSIDHRLVDDDSVTVRGWDPWTMEPVGAGDHNVVGGPLITADEAVRLQGAINDHHLAGSTIGRGTCVGHPALRPGTRLALSDATGRLVDGHVVATQVRHRIDSLRGYVTTFDSTPPPRPDTHRGAELALAVVLDTDDPDGRGRVRVGLPHIGDTASWWMPVVLPGLGTDKGVITLPANGDVVAVLGPADEIGRGVIVGGVATNRLTTTTPATPERFVIRLPGGGALEIDDREQLLRISDGFGSSLEMQPERVSMLAATNMTISAPGKQMRIIADRIDFERG